MVKSTVLGRLTDNMWDIEKDLVFKYLYDSHVNPLDYEDTPTLAVRIADDLDSAVRKVEDILNRLVAEKLVEHISAAGDFYRISSCGVEKVEQMVRKL